MKSIKARAVDNFHRRLIGDGEDEEYILNGYAQSALNERGSIHKGSPSRDNRAGLSKDFGYGKVFDEHANSPENKKRLGDFYEIHRQQYKNKDNAVQALVRVVRKCLKDIMNEQGGLELARKHMLKAFRRFDTQQTESVTPRDFCLAVSVLIGDDAIVLNKRDWTDIIAHFIDEHERFVEYEVFCDHVLNPKGLGGTDTSSYDHHSHETGVGGEGKRENGSRRGENRISSTNTGKGARKANAGQKNIGQTSIRSGTPNATDPYNLNPSYGLSISSKPTSSRSKRY